MNGTNGIASAIAAGGRHSCAIQTGSGAVICWFFGDAVHYYGEATPPPSVDGSAGTASAIATGRYHSCAIQAETGAVVCWGNDGAGQATPSPSVDGRVGAASAISAGHLHSCAIQAGTGAVVCWGWNYYGQATPPPSVNGTAGTASAIAAGGGHSCAIQTGTRAVVCWGSNAGGQATPPPAVDGSAGTASAIAAGSVHSCAIQSGTGAVVCWGRTDYAAPPPSVNGTEGSATALAAGYEHSCAIQADSAAVVCWGGNSLGQYSPPRSVNGTAGRATAIAISFGALAIQAPECSDGLDADGDVLVDYPSDPGCDSPEDYSERSAALACDDGVDNDADREADYPADPGCDSPTDAGERGTAFVCDDGGDNDGDGHADIPNDPGCEAAEDETETSLSLVCDDGLDNDGDGSIDYPADRNCTSSTDRSEDPEQCDDDRDNDGNGLIDYPADPNCSDINDRSERVTPVFEVVKGGLDLGNPLALTVGDDGRVYGGAVYPYPGGPGGRGPVVYNVFQVNDGIFTPLASLPLPVELDLRGFIRGRDGAYYGLEQLYCGECSFSELVKITSDGVRTVLAADSYDQLFPSVVGSDGAVYGSGYYRGYHGALFRIDTAGTFSILQPSSGLVGGFALGSDGLIYAPIPYGSSVGGLARFDNAGNLTTLHEFSGPDGAYPTAPLTLGRDGAMYGVTRHGGGVGVGAGTVFRVDPSGNFTSLHAFDWTDGGEPQHRLLLARDGVLYGVTTSGIPGAAVFRIDGGTVTSFSFPLIPFFPTSALVQGNDCALYGLASNHHDEAVVYRVFEPGTLCQQLDFDPLPDRSFGDPPFTVSVMASSRLPVSFSATGSCTVSGDQVTLTGAGLCTLTALQLGDADYAPAPEVSHSFHVLFDFAGFLRPVMNPPVANRVHAGGTVPIRFSLGGDQGREVLAEGSPEVRPVPCDASAPVNDIEGLVTKRSGSLRYAPTRRSYTYLWKTDKSWTGTCQELALELIDGSVHRAIFRFEGAHHSHAKGKKH